MVPVVTVVMAVTEVTEASTAATEVADRGVKAIGTDRIAGNMADVQATMIIESRMILGRIPRVRIERDRHRLTLSCTSRKE